MRGCMQMIPASSINTTSRISLYSFIHLKSGLNRFSNTTARTITLLDHFSVFTPTSRSRLRQKRRFFRCNSQLTSDIAPATSALYGVLLGGGLFAYTRSGSKVSLLGGLTGAALMATAYFLIQAPETKEIGDALGFGSALLFASVFATRKVITAGIGALVVFISAYLQDELRCPD